jgi:hypothetical protein
MNETGGGHSHMHGGNGTGPGMHFDGNTTVSPQANDPCVADPSSTNCTAFVYNDESVDADLSSLCKVSRTRC